MRFVWLVFVVMGCGGGPTADAGSTTDAGFTTMDAGPTPDAGSTDAGSTPDSGVIDAGPTVGDACSAMSQCGGAAPICQGFGNGVEQYCVATCTARGLFSDGGLPRAECPARSVCLPDFNRQRTGTCLAECNSDTDCRTTEGYFCRRLSLDGGTGQTSNGYCAPMHCRSRGCSSSFECFC